METVLVVGASGNIGVSTIIAALRSGRNVLAVVRNKAAQEKITKNVPDVSKVTFVEADVVNENGVQGVVDQVKAGELPAFQHVYGAVGFYQPKSPIQDLTAEEFKETMDIALGGNFYAYRATIPYLIEQGNPESTWTLVTGGAGDFGFAGVTAIGQGALYTLCNVAIRELAGTNVRFNEVYLCTRVDYDAVVDAGKKAMKASDFGKVYEAVLANKKISAGRVSVFVPDDLVNIKFQKKNIDIPSTGGSVED